MSNLNEIVAQPKKGDELFFTDQKDLSFNLSEFWSWNQSNLLENRTRGILAEFIVAKALDIDTKCRVEWDDFDLITKDGVKIEIKSAAFVQSWEQKQYSTIQFNVSENKRYINNIARFSDYYVFCLFHAKDEVAINPMNLSQWTFYVLKTEILNTYVKHQKSISLNSLLKLNPAVSDYHQLKNFICK
jgi:hypothetical protein